MARRSLLAAAAAALIVLGGCTGETDFDKGSARDVRGALQRAGLATCSTRVDTSGPPGAVSTIDLVVGEDCANDTDPRTIVRLIKWKDEDARDAAVQRAEAGRRVESATGATWTYGPFTITVSGEKDDREFERVAEAMEDLGAE